MDKKRIVIVDDEVAICEACQRALVRAGYHAEAFFDGQQVLDRLAQEHFDLMVTDLKMPSMDGVEVIKKAKEISPHTDVIVMTGFGTIESAVETIKLGSYDYITKPFEIPDFVNKVHKCLSSEKVVYDSADLEEIDSFYEISKAIHCSTGFEQLYKLILESARSILDADGGCIMLADEKTGDFELKTALNLDSELLESVKLSVINK